MPGSEGAARGATAVDYREIAGRGTGYAFVIGALVAFVIAGLVAAHAMDSHGHAITGMSNRVVWGIPHVFAIFLIVAASGALNVASMASVFGRAIYAPLARLSGVVALCLLIGGLAILVLDLGRPDRLAVAMTHYNLRSVFAWNVFLYTGFLLIVAVYLWLTCERRLQPRARPVGCIALVWRLVLTTGTGSIFGFLVARDAYDSALLAPLFVAMSFSLGSAVFIVVLMAIGTGTRRTLGLALLRRLVGLQSVFIGAVGYFVLVYYLTMLYAAGRAHVARFLLVDGGVYPLLFWGVQVLLGTVIPLALFQAPALRRSRRAIASGVGLVILGGFAQIYVIVIGGQTLPLRLFPGLEVAGAEGAVAAYAPRLVEFALGLGGTALALLLIALAIRVLPFVPASLGEGGY